MLLVAHAPCCTTQVPLFARLFQVVQKGDKVAVIGDGKLGLLVAQALIVQGQTELVHFGKHEHKLSLVQGGSWELVDESTSSRHAQVRCCMLFLYIALINKHLCKVITRGGGARL